jgi:predicted Zn-dependent peptidase
MSMNIRKKIMSNGLTVVSEAMPHLRSVSLGVWVKSGSRCESDEMAGISHFIEHLLFKGTQRRSTAEIAAAIDSVGGRLDAFTDKEYVGYFVKVMDEHLPLAFDLLSDIVLNPTFPAKEVERERNVIFEEINMVEDSPQELILDIYMDHFWKAHPLGRPITGTRESVARITRNDVLRFFKKQYNARNIIVAIAGNIRHREVQGLVERYFSELEMKPADTPGPAPKVNAGRSIRRKAHLEQAHMCLGTDAPPMASEERYCSHLLSTILGGGMSSRLFQSIREKRGLVYSIYTMLNCYHDAGSLVVYAGSTPEKAPEVVELTLKEFGNLREKPVTHEELKRAKEYIKGSVMLGLESSSSRMTNLAQQMLYHERLYEPEEILRAVDRVTAREIRQLANDIFDPSRMMLTALSSGNCRGLKSAVMNV